MATGWAFTPHDCIEDTLTQLRPGVEYCQVSSPADLHVVFVDRSRQDLELRVLAAESAASFDDLGGSTSDYSNRNQYYLTKSVVDLATTHNPPAIVALNGFLWGPQGLRYRGLTDDTVVQPNRSIVTNYYVGYDYPGVEDLLVLDRDHIDVDVDSDQELVDAPYYALGSSVTFLENGVCRDDLEGSLVDGDRRSALAYNAETIWLVSSKQRRSGNTGVDSLCGSLRDSGATHGVYLDGGGSASMAVMGEHVNPFSSLSADYVIHNLKPYRSVANAIGLVPVEANCQNNDDDDGDGLVDCADQDCVRRQADVPEDCADELDNDCDGLTDVDDEQCHCSDGQISACGTSEIGLCAYGERACENGQWSPVCVGAVEPVQEICDNGLDENCDGQDDVCLMQASFVSGEPGGFAPATVCPGDEVEFTFVFTNTGEAAWTDGEAGGVLDPNALELRSVDVTGNPADSFLYNEVTGATSSTWINRQRVGWLDQAPVGPGEQGTFTFTGEVPLTAQLGETDVWFRAYAGGQPVDGWLNAERVTVNVQDCSTPTCPDTADCLGSECGLDPVCSTLDCGSCPATPHDPICAGDAVRTFDAQQVCNAGNCEQEFTDVTCGYACDSGACCGEAGQACCSIGVACIGGLTCNGGACLGITTDVDGDGHDAIIYGGDDCDDSDAQTHPGATEQCDGRDNDCNDGVQDEESLCWRMFYRYKSPSSETRCWGDDENTPPAFCSSYRDADGNPGSEREAFPIATQAFDGNVPLYSCHKGDGEPYFFDQIFTMNTGDVAILESNAYVCTQEGRAWPAGSGPAASVYQRNCDVRRYVWEPAAGVGNGHFFSTGNDSTNNLNREAAGDFATATNQTCF